MRRAAWAAAAMLFFLAIAVSRHFEKATTPHSLGDFVHIDLRKILSVFVFALVGLLLALWRKRGTRDIFPIALMVAAYSAVIEVAQYLHGEREGLYWNTIDVLCGLLGGAIGSWSLVVGAHVVKRFTRVGPVHSDDRLSGRAVLHPRKASGYD